MGGEILLNAVQAEFKATGIEPRVSNLKCVQSHGSVFFINPSTSLRGTGAGDELFYLCDTLSFFDLLKQGVQNPNDPDVTFDVSVLGDGYVRKTSELFQGFQKITMEIVSHLTGGRLIQEALFIASKLPLQGQTFTFCVHLENETYMWCKWKDLDGNEFAEDVFRDVAALFDQKPPHEEKRLVEKEDHVKIESARQEMNGLGIN